MLSILKEVAGPAAICLIIQGYVGPLKEFVKDMESTMFVPITLIHTDPREDL